MARERERIPDDEPAQEPAPVSPTEEWAEKQKKKITALRDALVIDKGNLDDELVEHPQLVYDVATGTANAMSMRDGQKQYLAQIEGRIRARATDALVGKGGKATVKEIDAALEEDLEWIKERQNYQLQCSITERWFALKESFNARGYALHNLTAITVSRMKAENGQFERDPNGVEMRGSRAR